MTPANPHNELLPHLFRQEFSKMTAVLCRHFGFKHIEIAEDIASDAFLKAFENWSVYGLPDNPTAWLYTVAKNKAKDYVKHVSVFETHIKSERIAANSQNEHDFEFSSQIISDSQLAMIFAVCNPSNSAAAQICLALQILCAFSVQEIANAFLTKPETIKKRLLRARATLRKDNFQIESLDKKDAKLRLDSVLKTLYLLFNEGYFSKTSDQIIRRELCSEAVRLTKILTEHSSTNTPQTNALLALMCFQSSRLEARTNKIGEAILFDEQDKNLWDKSLVDRGNHYLVHANDRNEISKYHIEAAIAYWHTAEAHDNKWQYILQLYNQLILVEYSPITALNRTFAYAKVYGCKTAIPEAERLNLTGNNYYHALLGYLYTRIKIDKAINHYEQAIKLTKSKTDKQLLARQIIRLKN